MKPQKAIKEESIKRLLQCEKRKTLLNTAKFLFNTATRRVKQQLQ